MFERMCPDLKMQQFFRSSLVKWSAWAIRVSGKYSMPPTSMCLRRRKRLIYVASLFHDMTIDEAKQSTLTVRHAIASLPPAGSSGDALHDLPEKRTTRVQEIDCRHTKKWRSRSQLPSELELPCHQRNPDGFKDVYEPNRFRMSRLQP